MVMASDSSKVWKGNESINKNGKPENLNRKMCLDGGSKDCLDWKLIIDPFLKGKAQMKVVRYAGQVDGSELPVVVKDPRDRSIQLRRNKEVDLPVPKFKYDKWSVGSPPLKSIFIYGLNDNVDQEFLTNLFQPLGAVDQLKVYYHHKTRRHLGIAYASFRTSNITKEVIAKYHGISIMGNIVSIKPDPLCQITKKALDCLTKNPQANIQEVIQSIQHKSLQKKTAAWAFKHNERSQNYYMARGKTKHEGDKHRDKHREHVKETKNKTKPLTPVKTEVKPKKEEEKHLVERKSKRPRDSDGTSAEVKLKSIKTEAKSMNMCLATQKIEEKVKDIEREKKLYLADSVKYEDWKMRHELQIRADKTNRYIKEHYGEVPRSDKYKEYDKYYDKYYDHYRSSSRQSKYYDLYALSKYDKYKYSDKYAKYYDYYNEKYRKRKEYYSSSGGTNNKDYERSHDYRDPLHDNSAKLYFEHLEYSSCKYESSGDRPKSRQRSALPSHEQRLTSKRRRSYSPDYTESPLADTKSRSSPQRKVDGVKGNGSSTSHDTGYNSISPALPSPNTQPQSNTNNPYGCARAIPRKDISRLKTIGFKSEVNHGGSLSSSPMSLDEEQSDHEMEIEDISPHPEHVHQPSPQQPPPVFDSMMATGLPPFHEMYLPSPAPSLLPPFPFQTGQWLHATYPDQMYRQYYNPEEAADILARREAEKEAAKKQREMELYDNRRSKTIEDFINEMIMILKKDTKIRLNEKVAFVKLEDVWNEEQEIKRKEEEQAAKEKAERLKNDPNALSNSGPAMLSLSEMRSISDAKSDSHIRHQSHVRQANLSFKVPKLSSKLGMRAQVIVKKTLSPSNLHEPVVSDDDVKDEDLLGKPSQVTNRYNTIYSSSDESQPSDSSASEDEEIEEAKLEDEKRTEKLAVIPEVVVKLTAEVKQVADEKYTPRTDEEEELVLEDVFRGDLLDEDKNYFKLAYEILTKECDPAVEDTIWITPPEIPKPARRSRQLSACDQNHSTGCARTEGYYKITKQEKIAMKLSNCKGEVPVPTIPSPSRKGTRSDGKQAARSTRAKQRRQATHYFDISDVQYLQLQSRRKMVRFQRSNIHEWGLFALEPINADEMVIEYVGEVVREIIADMREKGYERQGIGSSYMFRIDQSSYIVDATHRGSISRFINHNCDPNCYARVISVGSKKKVVIYSKRDIAANEEITYDYKFAIEDDENKIPCLCRATACRGFLN